MQQVTDWVFVFVFALGFIGLILSTILYFANKNESFSARILAAYLFCASLICLNFNLTNTEFYLQFPHLWRIIVWAAFSIPSLAYLYVRTVLEQEFKSRRTDILFFLPAILFTLTMVPFYLTDTEGKLKVVRNFMADKTLISSEPEGLLPLGWGFIFRMGYGLIMAIAQYIMLARWRKKILYGVNPVPQNVVTFKWLFYFTVVISISYAILFVETVIHVSRFVDLNRLIILTVSANIFFISTYLLFRPNILYGMTGWLQAYPDKAEVTKDAEDGATSRLKTKFSLEQEEEYKNALETLFLEDRPFLRVGYKIGDLSRELNIPGYLLSAFINQAYGKNFNELINAYRVDYLENMLQSSPENLQYTLEALGNMAGFNSRTAFISAVKKKTGKTPVEHFRHFGLQDKA
jgi:AraC-like DNA-binding protein